MGYSWVYDAVPGALSLKQVGRTGQGRHVPFLSVHARHARFDTSHVLHSTSTTATLTLQEQQ